MNSRSYNTDLMVYDDIFDVSKKLIVKKNSIIDFKLVHRLMDHGRDLKKVFIPFRETSLFRDFKGIFNEEKYFTIFAPYRTNEEIADVMKDVMITEEIFKELTNIEEHLPYTFRHILLVTAVIIKISMDLKGGDFDPACAALSGLLHDLGKNRIPKNILAKDMPLTQSEYNILKSHSIVTFLLLCYYLGGNLREICNAARDHHEMLDGSGYPRGTKNPGKYARLITPVDIFDALVSQRPYRGSPFTIRQALNHLINEANAGRVDREVVYHLIGYVRKEHPRPGELTSYDGKTHVSGSDNAYGKIAPD